MSSVKVKSTKLGSKIWISAILFGLVGQIAWVVENMYFATFAQNIFEDTAKYGNLYYVATTLMVIFSAITATVTTIVAGGFCDKVGKRKPFISIGYILWGITIMFFAFIPTSFSASNGGKIVAILVVFDCIMTVAGSTANDAAFNAWVADVTDVTNRGKLNTILSLLSVFAMVITLAIAMFTFDQKNYKTFFILLGIIPIFTGVISIFLLKDSNNIVKNANGNFIQDVFYGFKKDTIKANKMLYTTLVCFTLVGISQQVFMSYLINFVVKTLGIENYLIPLAVIIVGSAVLTGVSGIFFDKFGRKNFYYPLIICIVLGTFVIYLMKFMPQSAYLPILFIAGIIMLGSMLSMTGALNSTFQDYIPQGTQGRFQGVRMCFTVLIPMIIGPIITLAIGINSFNPLDSVAAKPPFEIFLASSIVALLTFIPMHFVRKDSDRLRQSLLTKNN
jgi:MFS family permease